MSKSLIRITDLTVKEIDELIATAMDIIEDPQKYAEICHGKKLATLFFEPSTRTRLSFEAGMCSPSQRDSPAPPPRARASPTPPAP